MKSSRVVCATSLILGRWRLAFCIAAFSAASILLLSQCKRWTLEPIVSRQGLRLLQKVARPKRPRSPVRLACVHESSDFVHKLWFFTCVAAKPWSFFSYVLWFFCCTALCRPHINVLKPASRQKTSICIVFSERRRQRSLPFIKCNWTWQKSRFFMHKIRILMVVKDGEKINTQNLLYFWGKK